jgi:P pilus assembly chaperone PapD
MKSKWNIGRLTAVFFIVLIIFPFNNLIAGVLVAPTSVILTEKDRTGRLTIQNPSDAPKEVSVHFGFGIPQSDSLGNVTLRLQDTTEVDHPRSAMNWIRAFPRRVVLAPGATQVVRFVANPPKDLPDGEYWARIVVRSQDSQAQLPDAGDLETITTRLNMVMQTAIVLKYRTGDLIAKLGIIDTEIERSDSLVKISIDMENQGNVSYVGVLKCNLYDANNVEMASRLINIAVYDDIKRLVELPVGINNYMPPFHVDIIIDNEGRKDVPADELIPGNRLEYTMTVP